jgi:signal transduction histidine kinase/HAMP domain-containing protein
MPELVFIFNNPISLEWPSGWIGWIAWLLFLALIALLQWRWSRFNRSWTRLQAGIFFGLALLVPVTSLLLPGLRVSASGALPPPLLPRDLNEHVLMFLAALPWFLGGGLLGPAPAAALAATSGIFLSLWGTHLPFLPLELALLGTLFGAAVQQRYRTAFFRGLRHPLVTALLFSLAYPVLFLVDALFVGQGILANRLDFAVTHALPAGLATGGSLLIAGLLAEGFALVFPLLWGGKGKLLPSPSETNLEARFLYTMVPLTLVLLIFLMIGDWIVAGSAARRMLEGRMANAAEVAADTVPFFLETGQNLIQELADEPRLYNESPQRLRALLEEDLRTVPYFSQLFFLDAAGDPVAGYPHNDLESFSLSQEELAGINFALNGVKIQLIPVPPPAGAPAALISFLVAVQDGDGNIRGVLVGRSDLAANPFAQPLLTGLRSMGQVEGEGLLVDEHGRILYHPNPARIMTETTAAAELGESLFYDDMAPDGTRQLVHARPVVGRPWMVILSVPARYAQQQALYIAAPLLGMILVLSVISVLLIRFGLRMVTSSLQSLAFESNRIAQGELDHPLTVEGLDEVGQLRRAFEQMRVRLKARLDELNRLLVVSQGVASTLEVDAALQPVLDSALVTGASSARVVLATGMVPEADGEPERHLTFGAGPGSEIYRDLDEQILFLTRQQERVQLTNLTRPRLLVFSQGFPRPQALLAIALRHENRFFGALWVAYDRAHQFSEEEVRYLTTLAGQAALAAANARLFWTAESGRQRLEAILSSTPDPVLVTDSSNRISVINPAARQVLEVDPESGLGQPVDQVIKLEKLLGLLSTSANETLSAELTLPDGQVYLATTSSLMAEGRRVGRVCVMRDVTHFKELDALKSDFVSTVSHDLRSPLTLIRGYATMLQMVGDLNEQQSGYVRKILDGVESMSRLVNNLLDLGRIEAGVGLQLEIRPVQEVIEQVINTLQLQAAQKRIQMLTELPQEPIPLLEADHALLQQALHNLVENAIKYTDPGGEVQLCLQMNAEKIFFEVRDTGIGIAPADQHRLFEKFFRASRKGIKGERGSGLGLAIVKSIAERHGGQVWVESQLGKGSKFTMSIPLRQAVPEI